MSAHTASLTAVYSSGDAALPLSPPRARLLGFDIARAIAICSMVCDHCALIFGPRQSTGWSASVVECLDGRASAIFVMLAGVGVSLYSRRQPVFNPWPMVKRGVVLLALGLLNLTIWQGDILRLFGVAIIVAAFLTPLSSRSLLMLSLAIVVGFVTLNYVVDYNARWNWNTMRYYGLWSPSGLLRNTLYDGFRPLFPWGGVLFLGLWLGRLDIGSPAIRRRMLGWSLGTLLIVEIGSRWVLWAALEHAPAWSHDGWKAALEITSMPPMPISMLAFAATAVVIVSLCFTLEAIGPGHRILRSLAAAGQLALSWYIVHIILGAAVLSLVGYHPFTQTWHALALGLVSFVAMAFASRAYKRLGKQGPFEAILRAVG